MTTLHSSSGPLALVRSAALIASSLAAALPAQTGMGSEPVPIPIRSVFVTLLEEVEVPAREAGVLVELAAKPGSSVVRGDLLGRVDDQQAEMALDRARIELQKATREAENERKIELAQKSLDLALVHLKRAQNSRERVPSSVSQTELEERRLAAEKAQLELEQAEFELATAHLTVTMRTNELRTAEMDVERRQIVAPLDGFIVEVKRERGEWVEPGESVVRIVRMDRLRAEGLLDARLARGNLLGRPVELSVGEGDEAAKFAGVVTFVSPEVEPVTGQIRVWAEIDNRALQLRPGMAAEMAIQAPGRGSQ